LKSGLKALLLWETHQQTQNKGSGGFISTLVHSEPCCRDWNSTERVIAGVTQDALDNAPMDRCKVLASQIENRPSGRFFYYG
jgi:hypothetical protein